MNRKILTPKKIRKPIIILFRFNIILLLLLLKNCITSECNRDKPFLKSNNCESSCTENEINNKECIIENDIIKAQWLNNIIFNIGEATYCYVNIAISENNDLFYIVSSYPNTNLRMIYAINYQGYGILNADNPKSIIEINDSDTHGRYESEVFPIKLYESTDDKEYFLSISKSNQNVEIFDLYENKYYFDRILDIFSPLHNIFTSIGAHLKLNPSSNDNKNTYIIGILACEYPNGEEEPHFYLYKVNQQ